MFLRVSPYPCHDASNQEHFDLALFSFVMRQLARWDPHAFMFYVAYSVVLTKPQVDLMVHPLVVFHVVHS